MKEKQQSNRLAAAESPYLKQHAHNPVDWYAWGEEALDKAKQENKPILLSIGYAACHWCHVMAHESFEDEETAALMNQLFVNIKVDREERPDLDKIYQTAHYLLTRQGGGWPLTLFLTPTDLVPFFSGTYFPREPRYQLPAFKDVLKTLASIYQNNLQDIQLQNQELVNILQRQAQAAAPAKLTDEPIQKALQELSKTYDATHGGFGGAPKFPQPSKLDFLLQHNAPEAIATLQHMAEGGIFDQLQGGFFRYSVDDNWQIPHFEKMLYDNGQLLYLYALVARDQPFFANIARETAQWAIQEMRSKDGGFFSSIDADSEGHEGKFYIWTRDEIQHVLTEQEHKITAPYFGIDQPANFEQHWHLHIAQALAQITGADKILASAKQKLLNVRNNRIAPAIDKKILTSWNSLMIKGLLMAGANLKEPAFLSAAQDAINFINEKLWRDKRLFASFADGKAYLPAYLDDYAFLIDALLTSLKISWQNEQLQFATELADALLAHFYDENSGGFFFTANDHEKILYRPKSMTDEAVPSGNGIAARVLLTLGHLLGETKYLNAAEKTLQSAWPFLMNFPAEHAALLLALQEFLHPPRIIILRGAEKEMREWKRLWQDDHDFIFSIPDNAHGLPSNLALRKAIGKTCAYICQGTQCSAAVTDINVFKNLSQSHGMSSK